jgi:hypothetical protein
MKDSDYIPDVQPRTRYRHQVLKAALILYGTLGILAFAIPQSVVNWLKDFKPGPTQERLVGYAEKFEQESSRIGADEPYKLARGLFLKLTGKDSD